MTIKQLSTRVSIVKRSAGQSAVEKASYISRQPMHSDYDGTDYRPKAKEDLVHHEVSLPEHAPREYSDPVVLWNAVEAAEKSKNAQLARMIKFTLPNDWSYEIAEVITRDFIQKNFTSKGMCADWAIHDSVNPKGQRNLHVHVLLTMRPLKENGEWDSKQHKVYQLDEEGNKIPNKNGKGYKCTAVKTTDWDSRECARLWRKNLCGTFNAVNAKLGLDDQWEYRSFREQGIELLPTIHLGPSASALERKGVRTIRGDTNREIRHRNEAFMKARQELNAAVSALTLVRQEVLETISRTSAAVTEKAEETAAIVRNALTEMVDKIIMVFHRMLLPTQGDYIYRLRGREKLQSPEYMYRLIRKYGLQDERDLKRLSGKLKKEFSQLDSQYKRIRSSHSSPSNQALSKRSSLTAKLHERLATVLTELAVIESYEHSAFQLQMEVIRGHQPVSLLSSDFSNDHDKNLRKTGVKNNVKGNTVKRKDNRRRDLTR